MFAVWNPVSPVHIPLLGGETNWSQWTPSIPFGLVEGWSQLKYPKKLLRIGQIEKFIHPKFCAWHLSIVCSSSNSRPFTAEYVPWRRPARKLIKCCPEIGYCKIPWLILKKCSPWKPGHIHIRTCTYVYIYIYMHACIHTYSGNMQTYVHICK